MYAPRDNSLCGLVPTDGSPMPSFGGVFGYYIAGVESCDRLMKMT